MLDDEIMVQWGPDNFNLARVVAIGVNHVSDHVDRSFRVEEYINGNVNFDAIIVEWITNNPLAHGNLEFAPVDKYLILQSVGSETLVKRK